MAIVPENRRLFAPMSVLENLEMGAYLHGGGAKEDFERVYTLFPLLHERRTQLAGTLSGGEQQMVAMGRALMSRPKLLLMDEPSMGLAPILVERNFEIIQQVHESGVAILVVEQNANVSLGIADRGYVLQTGRVVLSGRPRTCSSTRICGRPTLAVDVAVAAGRIRHRFPVFERQVYINSCSQGALSDSVREAYARYLDDWDEHGAPWEYWVGRLEAVRSALAGLVERRRRRDRGHHLPLRRRERARQRAPPRRRARHDRRQRLRVPDDRADHACAGAARRAGRARAGGADGTIPLERFDAAIDERTALVAVTHVCFRNGGRLDVEGIARIAHEAGAPVLLDAYQAIGSLPLDVRELDSTSSAPAS